MAARAEGFRIPTAEDAVSEQMFAITHKVVEQTLNQNANYQPIVTEQIDDWLGWLKSRPEAMRQACELRHNGEEGELDAAVVQLNEKTNEVCFDVLEDLAAAGSDVWSLTTVCGNRPATILTIREPAAPGAPTRARQPHAVEAPPGRHRAHSARASARTLPRPLPPNRVRSRASTEQPP